MNILKCYINKKICNSSYKNDNYMDWLFNLLSPIVVGVKPAEIVSFPPFDKNRDDKINFLKEFFSDDDNIKIAEFPYCIDCKKMFIYNKKSLDKTLKDKRVINFLNSYGYPKSYSLDTYLNILLEKFKEEIPHEIGIFLGYPIKDVMGFMGCKNLKLTKTRGWRVYGDPKISDYKYEKIMKIRKIHEKLYKEHLNIAN